MPFIHLATAQEKSVRPGINKLFENPDVPECISKFETESREIFAQRKEIVDACKLKPEIVVADIGAGTGLFTRLFAKQVGPKGKVYTVDIAPRFAEHIGRLVPRWQRGQQRLMSVQIFTLGPIPSII